MTELVRRNAHDVIDLTRAGVKSIEIARRLGITRQRVQQIQKAHGIQVRKGELVPKRAVYSGIGAPLTITTPDIRRQMIKMRSEGWKVIDIAKYFGCSHGWVSVITRKERSDE